ncbi:hypothetical protein FOMPIDRAFT_1025122, partial [Fomitopsis schrenkii]
MDIGQGARVITAKLMTFSVWELREYTCCCETWMCAEQHTRRLGDTQQIPMRMRNYCSVAVLDCRQRPRVEGALPNVTSTSNGSRVRPGTSILH